MSSPANSDRPGMTPILDDLNIDLIATVLSHTLFSPFFITWIPILNFARGSSIWDTAVLWPLWWLEVLCVYHTLAHISKIYNARGTFFLRPARLDWGEQLVLITGGASGVGMLLANTLAVRNVAVVVLDVRERLESENYNISYYKCDVSDPDAVEAVAARIRKEIGNPTIIINNAALVLPSPILSQSPTSLQQLFATNTLAHYHILRSFLPYLVQQNAGHVVTMSSILGQQGVAHLSGYCASKAALISLHRSLRRELHTIYNAPNVRTTLLLPGHIKTPLFSALQLPPNKLRDFLAPPLSAHVVVKEIIRALDERESGEVRMPVYARWVWLLEGGPEWVREGMQWWTGADWGMAGASAAAEEARGLEKQLDSEGKERTEGGGTSYAA